MTKKSSLTEHLERTNLKKPSSIIANKIKTMTTDGVMTGIGGTLE